MFERIGCPMHFGVSDEGLKNCIAELNRRFPEYPIRCIPEEECPEEGLPNLKWLNSVAATCEAIARAQDAVIQAGEIPLFFGGDHSAAIGTVAGSAAHYENLGLIWIDAHTDINTDTTTVTGNIHGMPVSALLGMGHPKLCGIYGDFPKLKPENIVMIGIRDADPPEQEIVRKLGIRWYSYAEAMQKGVETTVAEALEYLAGCEKIHVSFDLDSMDPAVIRGVTVPVESGFVREDIRTMFDCILRDCPLASMDIVEYNPAYDSDGETGRFVHELMQKTAQAAPVSKGRRSI